MFTGGTSHLRQLQNHVLTFMSFNQILLYLNKINSCCTPVLVICHDHLHLFESLRGLIGRTVCKGHNLALKFTQVLFFSKTADCHELVRTASMAVSKWSDLEKVHNEIVVVQDCFLFTLYNTKMHSFQTAVMDQSEVTWF